MMASHGAPPPRTRCAIYTRKSTSAGLDQDFTSLDAQREACEAYVASQKHAGWQLLPTPYDDGGFTGANLDRPALQQLLEDVARGEVGCVVVYKVDRLSRSLLDFARLLSLLDQHDVAFVSVTQHFNTQTSMGRLTLNILLSFAQFEREMISERTRDKMGAARRKGKWLGGHPALGYDVDATTRKLVVNPTEAALVREIYEVYLREQSILAVVRWLNHHGHRTKRWVAKTGTVIGGGPFSTTRVQTTLSNATYLGKVFYQGELFEGEHDAVIDETLWQAVADLRARNRRNRSSPRRARLGVIPAGLLHCRHCGTAMFHTYSQKGGRRYRYYVCTTSQKQGKDVCPVGRINAADLERGLVESLRRLADDHAQQTSVVTALHEIHIAQRQSVEAEIATLESELRTVQTPARNTPTPEEQRRVQEMEQRLSARRVRVAEMDAQMLTRTDLQRALDMVGATWDVLETGEKAMLLTRMLDRADYDGNGTLGMTLNPRGIRSLTEDRAPAEAQTA